MPAMTDWRTYDYVFYAFVAIFGTAAGLWAVATQPQVLALMLALAHQVSNERDSRISLSQIHVNPLKWLGMALLGLLTMLSVAATHLGRTRAMAAALVLFAASAGPTAAIVLVQANPFQAFTWVSPAPFLAVADDRAGAPQPGVPQ